MNERPSWHDYFLNLAHTVATRADCSRRQVGAVIVDHDNRVVSTGYNGAPAGDLGCLAGACPRGRLSYEEVKEFTDYDSGPGKCISLHAEANALLYANVSVQGFTMYITDRPCPTCLKLIRGSGIRVVYYGDTTKPFTNGVIWRDENSGYLRRDVDVSNATPASGRSSTPSIYG